MSSLAPAATINAPSLVHSICLLLLIGLLGSSLLWAQRQWPAHTAKPSPLYPLGLSPWARGLLVWQALLAGLAFTGFFAVYHQPWRALPAVGLTLAFAAWLALRPAAAAWLLATPRGFWLGLQSFRLPLELLLYSLYTQGVIGRQMTFAGLNFDIGIGLTAPLISWLAWRFVHARAMLRTVIAWNLLGLLLLGNIVVVAVLSIPFPFQLFTQEPANRMVVGFPFVWLPTFLVPLALFAHLVSLRLAWHDLQSKTRNTLWAP